MTAEIWSTTPPTEDGWYWVRSSFGVENPFQLKGHEWCVAGYWRPISELAEAGYQFGPRIPTAEEIVSMRETLELFRRELMEKAKEKGGF